MYIFLMFNFCLGLVTSVYAADIERVGAVAKVPYYVLNGQLCSHVYVSKKQFDSIIEELLNKPIEYNRYRINQNNEAVVPTYNDLFHGLKIDQPSFCILGYQKRLTGDCVLSLSCKLLMDGNYDKQASKGKYNIHVSMVTPYSLEELHEPNLKHKRQVLKYIEEHTLENFRKYSSNT